MIEVPQSLGQRIIEAARLAVALHLEQARNSTEVSGQQVVIGGAEQPADSDVRSGSQPVTDGTLPASGDRSKRLPLFAGGKAA